MTSVKGRGGASTPPVVLQSASSLVNTVNTTQSIRLAPAPAPSAAQRHFLASDDLCKFIAERAPTATTTPAGGPVCLLAFSLGKESLGAWVQLRRYFTRVVPVHMYLVPGLSLVEDSIRRYEDLFQTPVTQLPHPSLIRMLRYHVYRPPEQCHLFETLRYPIRYTYDTVWDAVRSAHLIPQGYVAVGVRAADSLARHTSVTKWGAVNHRTQQFYPIFDWKVDRLESELRQAKVPLPPDYAAFGRSFDGIDYRFLSKVRDLWPSDYAQILRWFPLADVDLFRYTLRPTPEVGVGRGQEVELTCASRNPNLVREEAHVG